MNFSSKVSDPFQYDLTNSLFYVSSNFSLFIILEKWCVVGLKAATFNIYMGIIFFIYVIYCLL